ncbi:ISXo7 transposase, partial [mine drainage metagenome]
MAPLVRRTWAPRGVTPVLPQRGRSRRQVSVIAALSISPRRHRVRSSFGRLADANYDGDAILHFLQQLTRSQRGPIDRVWDRLSAHRGGPVARWLAHNRQRVRAHLVPGYRPGTPSGRVDRGAIPRSNPLANCAPAEPDELLHQTHTALLM